ncbi:MAG: hypothetical protein PHE70_06385 [Tepidanaerobacteraceae bacterium]|nr:hypothetical protein [Tepidanaerobacteraceae bacterium]
MGWKIKYYKEAKEDLLRLDHSQKLQVLKAIEKVSENPLPKNEGGYGKPLDNNSTTKLSEKLEISQPKSEVTACHNMTKA